jgi:endonuclease YncB( thermonuclease family)
MNWNGNMRKRIYTRPIEGCLAWTNKGYLSSDMIENKIWFNSNVKYQDRFLRAYREARERKRGLWGE